MGGAENTSLADVLYINVPEERSETPSGTYYFPTSTPMYFLPFLNQYPTFPLSSLTLIHVPLTQYIKMHTCTLDSTEFLRVYKYASYNRRWAGCDNDITNP